MIERIRGIASARLPGQETISADGNCHVESAGPAVVEHSADAVETTQHPLSSTTSSLTTPYDVAAIRAQFPVLQQQLEHGFPVYLDSGASAQKPQVVIDKEREVECQYYANAYRGRYAFGARVDEELETARGRIAQFLNAETSNCIAFTPGSTAGLNMIAFGWGRRHVGAGDEVLVSLMEHHANFVPWQQLARQQGARFRVIPLTDDGQLDLDAFDQMLSPRTKVVSLCGMSNVLGTCPPLNEIVPRVRAVGACLVIDAAQSAAHMPTDVREADIDFLVFSGHKLYGPSGVGVLYGRPDRLEETDPFLFGGHMISRVTIEASEWAAPPARFEAGTLPIVQAIGLGAAVEWVNSIGLDRIHRHEQQLTAYAMQQLQQVPHLRIFGPAAAERGGLISFRMDDVHPEDLAALMDRQHVFTRHGHHCAMPLHEALGVSATTRASFAAYNTTDDVDALITAIRAARETLHR
ncbi:MAG: SufS family cysteine desulfurase [Planctomycetaceae bacterium]|nr:SufS family cysteine desulfurase [Planctomycetaceae bacterium]